MMMTIPSYVAAPLGFVPKPVLQRIISKVFMQVLKSHPEMFERLGDFANKKFAFQPSDLPIGFIVEPNKPKISVHSQKHAVEADATIRGPLVTLLALMEGKLDGDALFFSRDITVTGDMEAVLALRNALDDSAVDLPKDLSKVAGPLAPIVESTASYIREKALGEGEKKWN